LDLDRVPAERKPLVLTSDAAAGSGTAPMTSTTFVPDTRGSTELSSDATQLLTSVASCCAAVAVVREEPGRHRGCER